MTIEIRETLKRFIQDEHTSSIIRDFLIAEFLKTKSKDVNYLAASKLAVDFLFEAWGVMESLGEKKVENEAVHNRGL